MAITLTNTASAITLTLPDALAWIDEYGWSPVKQTKTETWSGSLLIEEQLLKSGRPITLEGSKDRAWCTRALMDQLQAWVMTPNIRLVLVLRGISHNVTFDHIRGAFAGLPVAFYDDGSIELDDPYFPTLRFLEL